MKTRNQILIILGWIATLAISIYSAQPWGGNYAYQNISGYLKLILFETWISLPFIILYFLNKKYGSFSTKGKILLFSAFVVSIFNNYVYIDAVFIHTSSTSVLIFITLPLFTLLFLGVVSLACMFLKNQNS